MLALVLWCLSPNVIAWASTIYPDVPAAALGVAGCYLFWRWLKAPNWPRAFAAGVVLGLLQLTKMTWCTLFGIWPILWLVFSWRRRAYLDARGWLDQMGQIAGILLLGGYVLNVGYGFEGSFERLGKYTFLSRALAGSESLLEEGHGGNRFASGWLGLVPLPLPKNYVSGIDLQKFDFERGKWSYLRGQWKHGGWWYYYLYALAIKIPIGTWALALLALLVGTFGRKYGVSWQDDVILLAPPATVLLLVSSQTGFNHHLRYVLPIFPFAFVWMSKVACAVDLKHWRIVWLAAVALLWSVTSSLWAYPHSLSYFNELVGGPSAGHAHLGGCEGDSNIDSGQDLLYLKRWLDKHPEARPLGLAFNGAYDPAVASIEYTLPPAGVDAEFHASRNPDSLGPLPGWYAVSVNKLRSRTRTYAYFLRFQPVAKAGYSIYIYHITLDDANRLRHELSLPELPASLRRAAVGTMESRGNS